MSKHSGLLPVTTLSFLLPALLIMEISTEQQERNILEVFHDAEPGSEIDPIVREQSFIHEHEVWCA